MIVLTGPESCGKSTMATFLGARLAGVVVPEVARTSLTAGASYSADEVIALGQDQQAAEASALEGAGAAPVIADTDHSVIELWYTERFGPAPDAIQALWRSAWQPRYYLLCYPDLPWQPDPLRENPTDRERLFGRYLRLLDAHHAQYRVLWGIGTERERRALAYVESCLS